MPNYLHMQIAKYVKLAFACPWLPSSGLYSPDPRACRLFGGICTRYLGEASPLPGSQGHCPSPHPYRLPPTPFSVPATGVQREAGTCPAPAVSSPKRGLDELGAASSAHLATKSSQRTDEIPQRTPRGTHTVHEIIITVVIHLTEGRKLLIKGAWKIKGTANNRGQASCVVIWVTYKIRHLQLFFFPLSKSWSTTGKSYLQNREMGYGKTLTSI